MLDGNDGSVEDRPVFFYRGNLLYAARMNQYKVWMWKENDCLHGFSSKYFKAHFFTWTTGEKELSRGINLCPLVSIPNVTTTDIRHRTIIPQNSIPETIIPEIDLIPN